MLSGLHDWQTSGHYVSLKYWFVAGCLAVTHKDSIQWYEKDKQLNWRQGLYCCGFFFFRVNSFNSRCQHLTQYWYCYVVKSWQRFLFLIIKNQPQIYIQYDLIPTLLSADLKMFYWYVAWVVTLDFKNYFKLAMNMSKRIWWNTLGLLFGINYIYMNFPRLYEIFRVLNCSFKLYYLTCKEDLCSRLAVSVFVQMALLGGNN